MKSSDDVDPDLLSQLCDRVADGVVAPTANRLLSADSENAEPVTTLALLYDNVVYYIVAWGRLSGWRESLLFVETVVFTKRITRLGLEDPLRDLQVQLLENPTGGDLDPGTGGLRKIRMPDPTRRKGKRGGARVHYLWLPGRDVIYLLFAYAKDEADALSEQQKKTLRTVVEGIKKERAD